MKDVPDLETTVQAIPHCVTIAHEFTPKIDELPQQSPEAVLSFSPSLSAPSHGAATLTPCIFLC